MEDLHRLRLTTPPAIGLLLFPGDGYRFLRSDEAPVATDECCVHNGKAAEPLQVWRAWGINSQVLEGVPTRKQGWFFRRLKAAA